MRNRRIDAFMRDFYLYVPADCVASISVEESERALAYMQRVLEADTTSSIMLDLRKLGSCPVLDGRG